MTDSNTDRPAETAPKPVTHFLKTWPQFFASILDESKPFEARKDDRNPPFQVGDELCLQEFDPSTGTFSGREVGRIITYILRGTEHVAKGYAILGLSTPAPVAEEAKPKTGIELISEERERQTEKEGWTTEHDDTHSNGELATAGACYAIAHRKVGLAAYGWPFKKVNGGGFTEPDGFKPSTELRNLIKAGALIAAEIDRLLRKELLSDRNEMPPIQGEPRCQAVSRKAEGEVPTSAPASPATPLPGNLAGEGGEQDKSVFTCSECGSQLDVDGVCWECTYDSLPSPL